MRRLLTLLVLCVLALPASSAPGRLVLVVANGVRLSDVLSPRHSNLRKLVESGALGVMNARTASSPDEEVGPNSMEAACATLGAGTRSVGILQAREGYNAADIVGGRTARQALQSYENAGPGNAQVVHLGVNEVQNANVDAKYLITIGELGSTLQRHGIKTAVVGNSDSGQELHREAVLIAAGSDGAVDFGDVGSGMVVRDPASAYGVRTDQKRLLAALSESLRQARFVVVDLGDSSRAARYAGLCTNSQAAVIRASALGSVDRMVGVISSIIDPARDRLILVSPSPSPLAVNNSDLLQPVVFSGNGVSRGLLYSPSTRTAGIVTNTDVSASVLDFFSLSLPVSFVGRPVTFVPGNASALVERNRDAVLGTERQPITRGLATFMAIAVVLATLGYVRQRSGARWAAWLAVAPAASMLAVLWQPLFMNAGFLRTVIGLVVILAGIMLAARLVSKTPWKAFLLVCWGVLATVVLDALTGCKLLSSSVMSYSPVEGARYYGIGNEHMGSAIGAAMLACGAAACVLRDRKVLRMLVLTVSMLAVAVAIGAPMLGANAGGAMSAAAAVAAGLILWRGKGLSRNYILLIIVAVPAALVLMLLFDRLHGGGQSHVARAAQAVASGGLGEMLDIIVRKASMNLMLLQYSPWSRLLMASVAAVVVLLAVPALGALKRLREVPDIQHAVIAAGIGAVAAFVFNDSGVVAGATCFIYVWTAVLIRAVGANVK